MFGDDFFEYWSAFGDTSEDMSGSDDVICEAMLYDSFKNRNENEEYEEDDWDD